MLKSLRSYRIVRGGYWELWLVESRDWADSALYKVWYQRDKDLTETPPPGGRKLLATEDYTYTKGFNNGS